jgi:hypothetical protein
MPPCESRTPAEKRKHRLQECAFCNTSLWLDLIKKRMTGLRIVELFMYSDFYHTRLPTLGDSWIARLFSLQVDKNGLRDLRIHVFPREDPALRVQYAHNREIASKLDKSLQERIRSGVEKYRQESNKARAL